MRNNPREIPNNFGMQSLIDAAYAEAQAHYVAMSDPATLSTALLIDMTLAFLEVGQWDKVNQLATLVLDAQRRLPLSQTQSSTLHYALGTCQLETNELSKAFDSFNKALVKADADSWLLSNIYRNMGLLYLKRQEFERAIKFFLHAHITTEETTELRGALPAILNCIALCKTQYNQYHGHQINLNEFEEVYATYQAIFTEKEITQHYQSRDFISHQIDRGQVTIALCEAQPGDNYQADLLDAEYCLSQALEARKANRADGVRLGDVCAHLGRVYELSADLNKALKTYKEAIEHYKTVWSDDAEKIANIEKKVRELSDKVSTQAYGNANRQRARSGSVDVIDRQENRATMN